jgi:tetratricopeptide (TPR) repeat protein
MTHPFLNIRDGLIRIETRLGPWLDRGLIVFFFALLMVYGSREIIDLDLWLHQKTGEVIVRELRVPGHDIFSFTLGAKPWFNHEWLFQVLIHAARALGGANGLIIFQNIILIAIFLILYIDGGRLRSPLYSYVVLYLTLLVMSYRFTIRPDIISFLFVALFLTVLSRASTTRGRWLWCLIPLQILWVNLHGFAVFGPILIFTVLLGELMKRSLKLPFEWNSVERLDDATLKRLIAVFALSLVAFLVNPQGIQGALYPFNVLGQISGKGGQIVFEHIQELARPITFSNILNTDYFLFFKLFIIISAFSFRLNTRRLDVTDLFFWVIFLGIALIAIRNVAYFGIVAAHVIFTNTHHALKEKVTLPWTLKSEQGRALVHAILIVFLVVYPWRGAQNLLNSASFDFDTYQMKSGLWDVATSRYPEKAVRFLTSHDFPDRMFNDFNSGAYLIGTAYPKRRVYIDGRTELYGSEFFKNYVAIGEGDRDAIERMIERYHVEGFFLSTPSNDLHGGLLRYLTRNPRWAVVYFDDQAIILLLCNERNRALIDRFGIDLNQWKPAPPDFKKLGFAQRLPKPFITRARLLSYLHFYTAAEREARLALEIMPHNAEAYRFIAEARLEQGDLNEAFKAARLGLSYASGDVLLRGRLALIYDKMGDTDKSDKVIRRLMENNPKMPYVHYINALLLKNRNLEAAIQAAQKACSLAPKNPAYHQLLGDLWEKKGDLTQAKKAWKEALRYDGSNAALERLVRV